VKLQLPTVKTLGNVQVVSIDTSGNSYVLLEELGTSAQDTPVTTSVVKFSRRGEALARFRLPVDQVVFVPRRPVAVSPDGSVLFLAVSATDAQVIRLSEVPIGTEGTGGSTRAASPPYDGDFQVLVRGSAHSRGGEARTTRPMTRTEVLTRAHRALTVQWTPSATNLGPEQSFCDPIQPEHRWKRPARLDGTAGTTVSAIPYRWGGYESVDQFLADIGRGKLAGDVCTCRQSQFGYCITPNAAGLDCSGFVSQAWGIPYFTTTGLKTFAVALPKFGELQPGDALNNAGSHVRLVESIDESSVVVLESATRKECQGVCRQTYRFTTLGNYKPIRRPNVAD
jgi:hypothetical protein